MTDQKTLLIVTAHPDDETFGSGGALGKYASAGVKVYCACSTRGEAGVYEPENMKGHATVGDMVFTVRNGDTVKILNDASHPQVAAPGYAMYYIWVIRHLEGNRYGERSGTPIFEPEHLWVTEKDAVIWPDTGKMSKR